MALYAPVRYGKTCDRCGAAITVEPGERQLCGACRHEEHAARRDTRQ